MKRFILIYLPIICITIAAGVKLMNKESYDAFRNESESSANFDSTTKDNSIKSAEKKDDSQLQTLQEQIEELNDKVNDLKDENNELTQEVRKERAPNHDNQNESSSLETKDETVTIITKPSNSTKVNSDSYVPMYYEYKTSFNSYYSSPVLLRDPKPTGEILFTLDKNDPVYVIARTNSQYYRVVVDGKRGYISKHLLNKK